MAYKIHKRGAFVIIENTVNGELKELNSQFVQITKGKTSLDQYEVLYNGVSQLKAVLGDIQDANGVAYVEADWDIFRYEQCGSVNSSEVANPYPAPTTVEVDITSDQIKDWVANPISILPSIGANEYYDIQKAVLEYKHNGTNYTYTNPTIYLSNTGLAPVSKNAFNWDADNIQVLTPSVTSTINAQPYDKSTGVTLTANEDLLTGNGTLRVIITYTIRTFGA